MRIIAIVVTYNGMKWYKSCFNSLRNSAVPVDTIVIDNKSGDGTIPYIKENYPDIHLIESNENLGFGKANNIGFNYAIEQNADYVFLLNQDAWVDADTIGRLIKKAKQSPEFGILSPVHLSGSREKLDRYFLDYINESDCPGLISDLLAKGDVEDRIYPVKFINAAMWLVSAKCLKTIGGFDPIFPHYGEDNNYIGRLEYHGLRTGIYPKVFGVHDRITKNSNERSLKERKNRKYIYHLTILTALYMPLSSCLLRSFNYLFMEGLNYFLHLSFKDMWVSFCVSMKIIKAIPRIRKSRKISKQKGLSFLYS